MKELAIVAACAAYARELGLVFHPDTRAEDYVKADGTPYFTQQQAAEYEAIMNCIGAVADPYEIGLRVWQDMGLLP